MAEKRIIIVGATSGIGKEIAQLYAQEGWKVGIAGRRMNTLQELQAQYPERIEIEEIDITNEDAPSKLNRLIEKTGGMDIYLHSSGIGKQNRKLDSSIELNTIQTNGAGFTRMITTAFNYFRIHGGQLAAISSIAGTKGMGAAPSYSATKRFQNIYLDSLAQLAKMEKLPITITDIRPGFVNTALLNDSNHYPLMMQPSYVAKKIVKAIRKKKRIAVIDWRYSILVSFWKMIPQWLWERIPVGH